MSEDPECTKLDATEIVSDILPESPNSDTTQEKPPQGSEAIEQPAKVMRVGTMMKQLLDEVRQSSLDESSRDRLRDIYSTSVVELGSALSPELRDELDRLISPFPEEHLPTQSELQVAKAQLVGWLEGLVQGIQATLFAQQISAQQQLANMRAELPPGASSQGDRSMGTYL
ncbi:MAG: DUF2587 domain-containing protein [Acidimicrobiia bacterium]|nr:DUF2587 domain-containing protein [Acidimicrobiia bacterium]MYC56996.1 DUF2587 domain-containing protein [Acidimicrobiia bacterium]MYG94072.1 DUF2587 domain-containing protein [Acidimicrobiia bacterium]MYI30861.1 DUF2587 domain-containing protein [Acidimicrobiia bacterium]